MQKPPELHDFTRGFHLVASHDFGGAIAFIYVNDSKKLDLMAVVMISFSVTLVYSMKAGATIREIERENNIFHLIDLEKRIDNRRNALGLEKSQPAWLYEQEKH